MERTFRSFAGFSATVRAEEKEENAGQAEDYSQYIDDLKESIADRQELADRLGRMVAEISAEYEAGGKKSFGDMQELATKEAAIRLVAKRTLRLTDHIKTYIDYFYSDPCPSDDPLTWGN